MLTSIARGLLATILFGSTLAQTCGNCQSFGVDFVDGGSYFQNSLSTDPFTALEDFTGCTNDTADNILVDPSGTQYFCSMTPMQPDNTPELVTCPIDKDQLTSGEWSILVISNNGNCAPIDYERDFYLSVGPQQTTTVSPTVIISTTTTPVESDTITSTETITSTALAKTTTVPKYSLSETITIRPFPTITVVTRAILTITKTKQDVHIVATSIVTETASCKLSKLRHVPDPKATIVATILHHTKAKRDAVPRPTARSASTEFKRAILEGRAIKADIKARFIEERHEKLLEKRAPDQPTLIVTDSSGVPVTETTTITAPTSSVTGTTTIIDTVTTTPTVTIKKGITESITTVTAPRQTITITFRKPVTFVTITATQAATLTITSEVTPAGLKASCRSAGGILH